MKAESAFLTERYNEPLFPFINRRGLVDVWLQSIALSTPSGRSFPLQLHFCSTSKNEGNFGPGWRSSLIDSSVLQIDANKFIAETPDGSIISLDRDKSDQRALKSFDGWRGEMSQSSMMLISPHGWVMDYSFGRITSLRSPSGETLSYIYTNGLLTSMNLNNVPLTIFVRDPKSGRIVHIKSGKNEIDIRYADAPIINTVAGRSVVSRLTSSIKSLSVNGKQVGEFEFSVDAGVNPRLTFRVGEQSHLVSWGAQTGFALSVDQDTVKVSPITELVRSQEIEITRPDFKKQIWKYNSTTGDEELLDFSGESSHWKYFLTGNLSGKLRSYTKTSQEGTMVEKRSFSYDEKGRKIREIQHNNKRINEVNTIYDDESGIVKREETLDARLMKSETSQEGSILRYECPEYRIMKNKGQSVTLCDRNGNQLSFIP
jgi:hypothetical protein